MTRLVVLTFAFLGWAFYEMSGGADFEPRGVRALKPERVAKAAPPDPKPLVFPLEAEKLVVKSALGGSKTVQAAPVPQPAEVSREDTIALLSQAAIGLNAGFTLFPDAAANITLASLEQGAAAFQQNSVTVGPQAPEVPVVQEPARDIREVAGTRVNMRDGPGTTFPVIARLNIGHKVEVLDDSGTGWLRLRVLPEQQVGWISASLISKSAN